MRRISVWTLIVVAVLAVGWAIERDIEDQPAPLEANALWYALSTVAQVAAALAALIGFFGLWRLDQLREQVGYHQQRQRNIDRERVRFWRREARKITADLDAGRVTSPEEVDQRFNQSRAEEQRRFDAWLANQRRAEEACQGMQSQLQRALRRFMLGTLAILVAAIASLVCVDALCAWPWTARLLIILAGLGLGIGPALVIQEALNSPWPAARPRRSI